MGKFYTRDEILASISRELRTFTKSTPREQADRFFYLKRLRNTVLQNPPETKYPEVVLFTHAKVKE
jgi:hypothetical protein